MFTTLTENLRLCSFAKAEIVFNLFLNFEQKWASCSYKIVLIKKVYSVYHIMLSCVTQQGNIFVKIYFWELFFIILQLL